MLVLSRKRDQTIMIGDNIEISIVDIKGDTVRIGIDAPRSVSVHRKEIFEAIREENIATTKTPTVPNMDSIGGLADLLKRKKK